MGEFDYNEAFSRNIGWLTHIEQLIIKNKTVAIAGVGGVGGFHLLTLCRLGIQNFHIADPDHFELANFNRQVGATISSLNQSKTQTLKEMAQDINPMANIKVFDAINPDNVIEFLTDCDLYMDGMDFFAVDTREILFTTCEQLKIPAITAAPLGMGVNYLIFDNHGMSFKRYFQWEHKTEQEKLINFAIGLAPNSQYLKYLVDRSTIDFEKKKGPSTAMACMLCAGVASVQALKILLNRGKIYSAPYYHVFDPYLEKYKRGYLLWGNKNPLQRIKGWLVRKILAKSQSTAPTKISERMTLIEQIIDLARWAPSGDNTQPWRFNIISDSIFLVLIKNPLKDDFYDFDGRPTLLSAGCLMESIRLATNKLGKSISWKTLEEQNDTHIEVKIKKHTQNNDELGLVELLQHRSVDRTLYQKTQPPSHVFDNLNNIISNGFTIQTFTDKKSMKHIIKMNMLGTQVRLVLEQAHHVHEHIISWDEHKSDFGIPYTAAGLSKPTTMMMKLMFPHWKLMHFFNYTLGGAVPASIEMDYLPGIHSAGFFSINTHKPIDEMTPDELIDAGMQIQRAWLYLTKMNLVLQPSYTPIILSYYARHDVKLTDKKRVTQKIHKLSESFESAGFDDKTIFIARYGYPKQVMKSIRSNRLGINELILTKK